MRWSHPVAMSGHNTLAPSNSCTLMCLSRPGSSAFNEITLTSVARLLPGRKNVLLLPLPHQHVVGAAVHIAAEDAQDHHPELAAPHPVGAEEDVPDQRRS